MLSFFFIMSIFYSDMKLFYTLLLFILIPVLAFGQYYLPETILYYMNEIADVELSKQEAIQRFGRDLILGRLSVYRSELILEELNIPYRIVKSDHLQDVYTKDTIVLVEFDPLGVSHKPYPEVFSHHFILIRGSFESNYIVYDPYAEQIALYNKQEIHNSVKGDMIVIEE